MLSWLTAFFEKVMDKDSGLACSAFARNSDNGRYGVVKMLGVGANEERVGVDLEGVGVKVQQLQVL